MWVLKLKGVEFEYVEEDVRTPTNVIKKYNPIYLEVPILVIHGTPIADHLPIHEYIEDVWKQIPLLPEDPLEKALVRFWATYAELRLGETTRRALYLQGEEQDEQVTLAKQALTVFEAQIFGKKFFGGDTPKYLDFILGWMPLWLGVIEEVSGFKAFDAQRYPSLATWMDTFSELPVVKENSPPRDKLVKYYTEIRVAAGLPVGKK